MRRVLDAVRALGIDLDSQGETALANAVARLEDIAAWPAWDESASHPHWSTTPGNRPGRPAGWEPGAAPRLVADGGPYVTLLDEDDGNRRGPLAGWPVAVKDLISVAGVRLRASSRVRADARPQASDAPIVAALRQLGASIVGTTVLHEFAFGVTGINPHTVTPGNPKAPGRITGGSSSGSAVAVAEGSARIAVGTDTGGSVRIPAALCGVVGYKPTRGLYPTAGVFPLSPTLDHVGLLAGSVADVRWVHAAFGFDVASSEAPRRVGVVEAELQGADPTVAEAVTDVFEALQRGGAEVVPVTSPAADETLAVSTLIMFSEAAAVHRKTLTTRPGDYGEDVRHRLLQGSAMGAWAYATACRMRRDLRRQILASLAGVDCLVGPTVGIPAPPVTEAYSPAIATRLVEHTRLANVTGVPALSLPVPGCTPPVGLQLTGASDGSLLGVGAYVERLLGGGSS